MSILLPTPVSEPPTNSPTNSAADSPTNLATNSPTNSPTTSATGVVSIASSGRDGTVDLVRALCLMVVVALHSTMVGVQTAPDGGLLTSVAMAGTEWFVPVSWFIQVMPLFFIAGGFASLRHWRQMRDRGESWSTYVIGRTRRLVAPTAVMFGVVGLALGVAGGLGVDPVLVAEARLRTAQPLWFLAVYLGVTSLVPLMSWMHARRPVVTITVLGLGVVCVDVARLVLDAPPVGFLNLGLVWLLVQQIGFLFHDGVAERWSRRRLVGGFAGALGLLFALVSWLPYSPDMLVNLNPPTAAIVVLGIAQFFLLRLLKPILDGNTGGATVRPVEGAAAFGAVLSKHAMAVYLWHMPVILSMVLILWIGGAPLPAPHSAAWWSTRIPWLLAVGAAMCVAVVLLNGVVRWWGRVATRMLVMRSSRVMWSSRVMRSPAKASQWGWVRPAQTASVVVMAMAGVVVTLLQLFSPFPTAVLSLGLLLGSMAVGRSLSMKAASEEVHSRR